MNRWFYWMNRTAFMAVMLLALAACNKEEEVETGGGTGVGNDDNLSQLDKDVLGLFAYNGGTHIESNVWSDKMTVGLFLTKDSLGNTYENDRKTYDNIRCEYTKEGWRMNPEKVRLSDRPAVIYAYAPYSNDVDPFNVHVECQSGKFYMYGTHIEPQTSVRKGDNVARILMKQVQALVDFRIRKKEWDGEVRLQRVVIRRKQAESRAEGNDSTAFVADSTNAFPVEGTLNIQSGELTHTAWGFYATKETSILVEDKFTTSARVLFTVLPYDIKKNDVEIVFTVNGRDFCVMLREDNDWVAGTRNIINLTWTGEGFEIEESIKPWNDIEKEIIVW